MVSRDSVVRISSTLPTASGAPDTLSYEFDLHMFLENPQYVIFGQLLSITILFPYSNFPSFAQTGFLLHTWYNVP